MGEYDRAFSSMNDSNVELNHNGSRAYYDTGKRPWPIAPGIVAMQSLLDAGYTRIGGVPANWALDLASRLREQEVALRTGQKVSYGPESWRAIENLAIAQLLMSKPGAIPPPVVAASPTPTPAPAASIVPPSATAPSQSATPAVKAIDFTAIDIARARVSAALQDLDAAIAAARR